MAQLSVRTDLYAPQEWNLSDFYKGIDDPQFEQELQAVQEKAALFRQNYRDKVSQLTPEEVARCLHDLEGLFEKLRYLKAFPMLVFSVDTRNTQAKQFLDNVQAAITRIKNQLLFFKLELQNLDPVKFDELLTSPALENYRHYLERIALFRPHQLPEEVEQTRNRDSLTGRQAFLRLRSVHLGEQKYQPVTTPQHEVADTDAELEALLLHPDANVRYEAYCSVRCVMQQHNLLYGFVLNTIAQDHCIESQMRGYRSTFHKQLSADEVPESVFRTIMDGVGDHVDLFQRYYQLKGKAIGQKIRTCDLYAPWSGSDELLGRLDYRTGVETLLEALKQFDIFYGNRAEEFFLRNRVDAKVRDGKRNGAFCFPADGKHSYLLLSYTEDYKSLFSLARQIGHGLHRALSSDRQTYFNSKPPLMLAEIASKFNELLLLDYLLKQAADDQRLRKALLTRLLEDQLNLLFRQSTFSRLELAIHERAPQSNFDHNFVNQTWMQLYRQLCGDAVEVLPEHQYDWGRIDRIYTKPFSCYQYTASNIVSLACYQKYQAIGKDFISGYLKLLGAGGSLNSVDALCQYVDVDLKEPATVRGVLDFVEGLINQLEAIV